MDWLNVLTGPVLQTLGPIVGTLVGGPAGGAIAAGVGKVIADMAGVAPTPEAVAALPPAEIERAAAAIAADPERVAALVALSVEETKRLQAQLADVQDARSAEKERTGWQSHVPGVLAVVTALGFIAVSVTAIQLRAEAGSREIIYAVFTAWVGLMGGVYGYYFGSSQGSKNKDATMSTVMKSLAK